MKTFVLFLTLIATLVFSTLTRAELTNKECAFSATKSIPALRKALIETITASVSFKWNPSSLAIKCTQDVLYRLCSVSFKAADGTSFLLHDSLSCYTDTWGRGQCVDTSNRYVTLTTNYEERSTDAEGNFVGPASCTINSLSGLQMTNVKSSVELSTTQADNFSVTYPE